MSEILPTSDLPIPDDSVAVVRIRRWNRAYKVAIIWLIGFLSVVLEQVVKLDSVLDGLKEGGIYGAILSPFLLVITLPLALLGSRLGSWKRWRRFRNAFTFLLPSLYLLIDPVLALHERAFPHKRFYHFTGVAFPRDARFQKCIIDDGFDSLFEPTFTYELTCSPQETDRLIRELNLTRQSLGTAFSKPPSSGWRIDQVWGGGGVNRAEFIWLEVDSTRTRLRLMCGST